MVGPKVCGPLLPGLWQAHPPCPPWAWTGPALATKGIVYASPLSRGFHIDSSLPRAEDCPHVRLSFAALQVSQARLGLGGVHVSLQLLRIVGWTIVDGDYHTPDSIQVKGFQQGRG
jgi:hypothetical protein